MTRVLPRTRWGQALGLFGVAASCTLVFFVALHPVTDFIGGIVYLLVGWALPTLAVVALALGLAWPIPVHVSLRLVLAALLSVPLGLNTKLPVIADVVHYTPKVSASIVRQVKWRNDRSADTLQVKHRPWGPLFTLPFAPQVRVGGDEGCGCFYFLDEEVSLYSDRVMSAIFASTGNRAIERTYEGENGRLAERRDIHFDLNLRERGNAFRATVEVFDEGEKIANFEHTGIPRRALADPKGVGRGRMRENFWANATGVFLHRNAWTLALGSLMPNYFPEQNYRAFVAAVVPRHP